MEGRLLKYATLKNARACEEQRELFEELHGHEVLVTVELAVSQANKWDWHWAAEYLLSEDGYEEWKTVQRAAGDVYHTAMVPMWHATNEASLTASEAADKARQAYSNPTSPEAWNAHYDARRAIMEPAYQAEHEAGNKHALVLNEAKAKAFAEIYIREGAENDR